MTDICFLCGLDCGSLKHKCKYCKNIYCHEHLLPEEHNCYCLKRSSMFAISKKDSKSDFEILLEKLECNQPVQEPLYEYKKENMLDPLETDNSKDIIESIDNIKDDIPILETMRSKTLNTLRRFLCYFNFHDWKSYKHILWDSNTEDIEKTCKRCGKHIRLNKPRVSK